MPHDWDSFLWAADQWVINYSLPGRHLVAVKLFSVGHALELYLKAANTKITGDIERAIKFRHDVAKIWADCKAQDPGFLPEYELRESVLSRELFDYSDYSQLGKDDLIHFMENQEFYVVAKYLPDLKYIGAPLKRVARFRALVMMFPNFWWADLFRNLRIYLGHHGEGNLDVIRQHIEEECLPPASVEFLKKVLSG